VRDITADMVAEFESGAMYPVLMADLEFDSETLYMWSGLGTISWNGNDYIGGGNLISISTMEETQELQAKGIVCTLNGIPSSLIAAALLERTRGRPFRLYLGAFDTAAGVDYLLKDDDASQLLKDDGTSFLLKAAPEIIPNQLIADPYRLFTGLMDVMEFSDNGQTAAIRLSVESSMLIGQRSKVFRYTAEDQKKKYPGDKGLDNINQLQDKQVVW
jgi:hypothetical protein